MFSRESGQRRQGSAQLSFGIRDHEDLISEIANELHREGRWQVPVRASFYKARPSPLDRSCERLLKVRLHRRAVRVIAQTQRSSILAGRHSQLLGLPIIDEQIRSLEHVQRANVGQRWVEPNQETALVVHGGRILSGVRPTRARGFPTQDESLNPDGSDSRERAHRQARMREHTPASLRSRTRQEASYGR